MSPAVVLVAASLAVQAGEAAGVLLDVGQRDGHFRQAKLGRFVVAASCVFFLLLDAVQEFLESFCDGRVVFCNGFIQRPKHFVGRPDGGGHQAMSSWCSL